MFEILDIVLLCLLVRRRFLVNHPNINKVLQKCQWSSMRSCQNMQHKTTRATFLFRVFNKGRKNAMFVWTMFVMRRKCGKRQRIRLYTMIDGEKVLFALWIFNIFSCAHIYTYYIGSRMHNIVSLQQPHVHTATYNCIFIICCAFLMLLLFCVFLYLKYQVQQNMMNVRWLRLSRPKLIYMENQKRNKMSTVLHFYMITTIDHNSSNKKEHCRKIYWLGRQV